jgi:ribonuclease HI
MINVYTDGACSNNGQPNALSGYGVYFSENDTRNESKKINGEKHTNNIAELTAFIRAIEILDYEIKNGTQVNIYTDSEYVIKCATSYGDKLSKNNWKTSTDKIPPNVKLVKKSYELYHGIQNIKLIHINAHTNKDDIHSIGNDNADKLANMAIGIEKCPYNCDNNDNTKIYIKISYEDKEDAKNLYAKWDNTKKSWYYTNDIPDENKVKLNELSSKTQNVAIKFVDDGTIEKKYINISYANKNKAKSLGARWDMSLKKWYYLKNNSEENIIKLRELEN